MSGNWDAAFLFFSRGYSQATKRVVIWPFAGFLSILSAEGGSRVMLEGRPSLPVALGRQKYGAFEEGDLDKVAVDAVCTAT